MSAGHSSARMSSAGAFASRPALVFPDRTGSRFAYTDARPMRGGRYAGVLASCSSASSCAVCAPKHAAPPPAPPPPPPKIDAPPTPPSPRPPTSGEGATAAPHPPEKNGSVVEVFYATDRARGRLRAATPMRALAGPTKPSSWAGSR